jgi:hypothetical protein
VKPFSRKIGIYKCSFLIGWKGKAGGLCPKKRNELMIIPVSTDKF